MRKIFVLLLFALLFVVPCNAHEKSTSSTWINGFLVRCQKPDYNTDISCRIKRNKVYLRGRMYLSTKPDYDLMSTKTKKVKKSYRLSRHAKYYFCEHTGKKYVKKRIPKKTFVKRIKNKGDIGYVVSFRKKNGKIDRLIVTYNN